MAERHDAFDWAGRPGKKFLLSAYCQYVFVANIIFLNNMQFKFLAGGKFSIPKILQKQT